MGRLQRMVAIGLFVCFIVRLRQSTLRCHYMDLVIHLGYNVDTQVLSLIISSFVSWSDFASTLTNELLRIWMATHIRSCITHLFRWLETVLDSKSSTRFSPKNLLEFKLGENKYLTRDYFVQIDFQKHFFL